MKEVITGAAAVAVADVLVVLAVDGVVRGLDPVLETLAFVLEGTELDDVSAELPPVDLVAR